MTDTAEVDARQWRRDWQLELRDAGDNWWLILRDRAQPLIRLALDPLYCAAHQQLIRDTMRADQLKFRSDQGERVWPVTNAAVDQLVNEIEDWRVDLSDDTADHMYL